MRSSDEIKELIIAFAHSHERVRAVLLNGSRANPNVSPDKYQDFDVVFIVTEVASFTLNHNWTNVFGKKILWQLPFEMVIGDNKQTDEFSYLMLFEDGNRIDLTLFPKDKLASHFQIDSLTVVGLDKDLLFTDISLPSDKDYFITKTTEKEFSDTCNEFWWVSTYVAKGLLRNQTTYAKETLENYVRPMFMKMIEWHIGTQTAFSVSVGKGGKFMRSYLGEETYNKILATYSDAQLQNNWNALFVMTELFGELASTVGEKLRFNYSTIEEINVKEYLKQLYFEA
jgi:aminoglycoside 6-adenylyltransferase